LAVAIEIDAGGDAGVHGSREDMIIMNG
jgi:hypothetical protein